MLFAGEHVQLPEHLPAERVLRQHAFHRVLDRAFRLRREQLAEGDRLQVADVAGVMVVELVGELRAGDSDLFRVDDDQVVARIDVRRVHGLVLAAQAMSELRRETPERLALGINDVPIGTHGAGFGELGGHDSLGFRLNLGLNLGGGFGAARERAASLLKQLIVCKAGKALRSGSVAACEGSADPPCGGIYNVSVAARDLTPLDQLITSVAQALRTLTTDSGAARPSPAAAKPPVSLNEQESRAAAGLMRVNHSGEIAAQALYRGQSVTARNPATRDALIEAAREEQDHLAWCETRLAELGAAPSRLNPLWYIGSFAIGLAAGAAGDRVSLGFVAETERQVEGHLDEHLAQLPVADA